MDERVPRAARNNAELCDVVARSRGVDGTFADDAWTAPSRTPGLYPDAVTLVPGVDARGLLARIDDSGGASVKDSFRDLDLTGSGYRVLFDAEWIHRSGDRGGVPVYEIGELVTLEADGIGSVQANRSEHVVGLSNVEAAPGADEGAVWRWLVAVAGHQFPGVDLVGYESGPALAAARAAGFSAIGPLRVWMRDRGDG
jgi:hypothetical protein